MFSAFCLRCYQELLDRVSRLQPSMNTSINMSSFRILGALWSHAFIISGILPDRLAFPCMALALLGPSVHIPDAVLTEYFQ